MLHDASILVDGDVDLAREEFISWFNEERPGLGGEFGSIVEYDTLALVNDNCNLACPYCVLGCVNSRCDTNNAVFKESRLSNTLRVVDMFLAQPADASDKRVYPIHFNGGEFLLDFDLMRDVVEFVKTKYSDLNVTFSINTNATLVTEEVAEYLAKTMDTVSISIDGYKEYNDITRVYHNKSGSFDKIIESVGLLNKYMRNPITRFQGTIDSSIAFDPDRVQEMAKYGMQMGRLGVDLLGMESGKAIEIANMHFDLVTGSNGKPVKVADSIYRTMLTQLNGVIDKKQTQWYCNGLSAEGHKYINYNVDSNALSVLCSYADGISVQANELDIKAGLTMVHDAATKFLNKRRAAIIEKCIDCDVVMLCKGGCVMHGLGPNNDKVDAACVYIRQTWSRCLTAMLDAEDN